MNITVIILAHHGDKWLPKCLETLSGASAERIRLVLVDNHGQQHLDQLDLSAFDATVVKTPKVLGFSEGNNFGLLQSFPDEGIVVFLNQDTWGEAGWLDQCIKVLEEEHNWGAITPIIRKYEHPELDTGFVSTLLDGHVDLGQLEGSEPVGTPHIPATAMVMRTAVLLDVGPFDPVFESYYEDYDLCRRIQEKGYHVGVHPGAVVHHFSGSAVRDARSQRTRVFNIQRNRLLHRLRLRKGSRVPALLYYLLLDWPRNLVRGLFRRKGSPPAGVTFLVSFDVIARIPRFISRKRDEAAWQDYLAKIKWPGLG